MANGITRRHSTSPGKGSTAETTPAFVPHPAAPFIVKATAPPDLNKNTSWFLYPGVWTMYFLLVFLSWLLAMSVFGCGPGAAWTIVNVVHFAVTYYYFHWKKGSPFPEDQGVYDKLTWWEQVDDGRQLTKNRKFLTAMPVALYLIAAWTMRESEYSKSIILLNTCLVFILVISKLPLLHKVRLFGINNDYPT